MGIIYSIMVSDSDDVYALQNKLKKCPDSDLNEDIYETQSRRDDCDIGGAEEADRCSPSADPPVHWGFSLTDHSFSMVAKSENDSKIAENPKNGDILVYDENIGKYRQLKDFEKVYIGDN